MFEILILTSYTLALIAGLASVVWINSELRKTDGKIILEDEKETKNERVRNTTGF